MPTIPRFRPHISLGATAGIIRETFAASLHDSDVSRADPFAQAFARYIGVKHAIGVPSGRVGLYLILKSLEFKKPGEIILPAFTYWAVPRVISCLKLKPVFVDIDPKTCTIDVAHLERHITRDTRAILPTHLYGRPCDMGAVIDVAKKYGLVVIEDSVQACGAAFGGQKTGSFGEAAYFAFGFTKNISLLTGGMVVTNNDVLAHTIRRQTASYPMMRKTQILKKAFEALAVGLVTHPAIFRFFSYPLICCSSWLARDIAQEAFEDRQRHCDSLPDAYFRMIPAVLQAELGLEQLRRLDDCNERRIQHATFLLRTLRDLDGIQLPASTEHACKNIFTNFPLRVNVRTTVVRELLKRGIDTSTGYMQNHAADCPCAAGLQKSILHLPMYPSLTERELEHICRALREIAKQMKR